VSQGHYRTREDVQEAAPAPALAVASDKTGGGGEGQAEQPYYAGVVYDAKNKAWKARLTIAGQRVSLGMFDSQLEAAKQVDRCALSFSLLLYRMCSAESPLLHSGVYKRDGDASGAHCGSLRNAEKAELDKMTMQEIKEKWARVNPRTLSKTSAYRGVCWCVAGRGTKERG
jgi:hypothetical protein